MTDQPETAEAVDEAQPIAETQEADASETQATEEPTGENETEAKAKQEEDVWPKKAVNAISRKSKQLGELRAKYAAEQQTVAELKKQLEGYTQAKKPENAAPQPGQYQTYEEYIDALTEYKVKQRLNEKDEESSRLKQQTEEKRLISEREAYINENAEKAKEAFSDFENVMQANQDDLGAIAPHVRRAFLDADNGAFALYALAKEGILDTLNEQPYHKVVATIARMEDKALAMSQKKPITKAPQPMTAVRGNASTQKRPEEMSGRELIKWVNS